MSTFIKHALLLPMVFGFIAGCDSPTQTKPFTSSDNQAIIQLLDQQAVHWSTGDVEKFMDGYWKSDSLQFIGKSGINYGWQTTLNNYKKNYSDTVAIGKLRFEILKINPLSADAAFLTGRFFLTRTIGNLEGIFTLVLRKIDGQWVIIYDHTS